MKLRKVTGKEIPAEKADRRPGDPDTLIASSEKARTVLGWKPQFDNIEKSSKVPGHGIQAIQKAMMIEINHNIGAPSGHKLPFGVFLDTIANLCNFILYPLR